MSEFPALQSIISIEVMVGIVGQSTGKGLEDRVAQRGCYNVTVQYIVQYVLYTVHVGLLEFSIFFPNPNGIITSAK